jgi:hypothetical protein
VTTGTGLAPGAGTPILIDTADPVANRIPEKLSYATN